MAKTTGNARPHADRPAASWTAIAILTAAYAVSFIDRTAVSVVQGEIKSELQLTDWQIGLMIGPAFAIVYSLAGVPLARLAERRNRTIILAWCIAIWSVMAMACGLARDFVSLFVARMGVGIGEAGGNPVSHSLIADLFTESRRSMAIASYTLGGPVGTFLGAAGVGWLASMFGWRQAFLLLGLPGFILVVTIWLWLREPARQLCEASLNSSSETVPPFRQVALGLFGNAAFRHLVWGGSLVVLVGYCLALFLPALLLRRYDLPLVQVGLITGTVTGLGGIIGTLIGGFAADRWGAGRPQRLALITALTVFPAPLLLIGGIASHALPLVVAGTFSGLIALYGYVAPAFTQVYAMSQSRSRATVTSIYYLVTNLIGLGIGPPLLGAISDFWAKRTLAIDALEFERACLKPTGPIPISCEVGMADGIEVALLAISLLPFLSGIHFLVVANRHGGKSKAAFTP